MKLKNNVCKDDFWQKRIAVRADNIMSYCSAINVCFRQQKTPTHSRKAGASVVRFVPCMASFVTP